MFGRHDVRDGKAVISAKSFVPSPEQQEVIDAYLAMQQAMVSADHDALRALVEDSVKALVQRSRLLATNVPEGTFALRSKHMSGAVQTKEEFISEVGGPLTYYPLGHAGRARDRRGRLGHGRGRDGSHGLRLRCARHLPHTFGAGLS